jgi:hypothetical protein
MTLNSEATIFIEQGLFFLNEFWLSIGSAIDQRILQLQSQTA